MFVCVSYALLLGLWFDVGAKKLTGIRNMFNLNLEMKMDTTSILINNHFTFKCGNLLCQIPALRYLIRLWDSLDFFFFFWRERLLLDPLFLYVYLQLILKLARLSKANLLHVHFTCQIMCKMLYI